MPSKEIEIVYFCPPPPQERERGGPHTSYNVKNIGFPWIEMNKIQPNYLQGHITHREHASRNLFLLSSGG